MAIPYRDKQKFANRAARAGIPPGLLKWREVMGFPTQHLDATELVGDQYRHGKFEQGEFDPKKTEKNRDVYNYPPRHPPVKHTVTYKRTRIPKSRLA